MRGGELERARGSGRAGLAAGSPGPHRGMARRDALPITGRIVPSRAREFPRVGWTAIDPLHEILETRSDGLAGQQRGVFPLVGRPISRRTQRGPWSDLPFGRTVRSKLGDELSRVSRVRSSGARIDVLVGGNASHRGQSPGGINHRIHARSDRTTVRSHRADAARAAAIDSRNVVAPSFSGHVRAGRVPLHDRVGAGHIFHRSGRSARTRSDADFRN